jgi:hypothetical protein
MRNKANLNKPKFTPTHCSRSTYGDLRPKSQIGTKPNKANLNPISKMESPAFRKNKKMENEPNFPSPIAITTTCPRVTYNDFYPKPKIGTNPNEPNFSRDYNSLDRHAMCGIIIGDI